MTNVQQGACACKRAICGNVCTSTLHRFAVNIQTRYNFIEKKNYCCIKLSSAFTLALALTFFYEGTLTCQGQSQAGRGAAQPSQNQGRDCGWPGYAWVTLWPGALLRHFTPCTLPEYTDGKSDARHTHAHTHTHTHTHTHAHRPTPAVYK